MKLTLRLVALALAGLGSIAWIAMQVGDITLGSIFSSSVGFEVVFDDATGLVPRDDVRLAGVRIGSVSGIRVEDGKAVVDVTVEESRPVPKDAVFELRWEGVLGRRFVQVVPPADATPDGPALADGDRVDSDRTREPADLASLLNNVEPLLGSLDTSALNRVMATVASVLEGREREVGHAIDASSALVTRLSRRADDLGSAVTDLATFVDGLGRHDREVVRLLDDLATTSTSLSGQSDAFGTALAETGELTDVLNEVLTANHEDLDVSIGQLQKVADTIAARDKELADGLRSLPWVSAALIRATNHGDWIQVYGRGFGVINAISPEPRVGPDYSDVGPDQTDGPEPLLGQPRIPVPDLPALEAGPLTINPNNDDTEGGEDGNPNDGGSQPDQGGEQDWEDGSGGLERLFDPFRAGTGAR